VNIILLEFKKFESQDAQQIRAIIQFFLM